MLSCFILSNLWLRVFRLMPIHQVSSRERWFNIAPLAAVFIVNIVLGNYSLDYVPVSFMQTVKSSVPAFTYTLQIVLGYRAFECDTVGTLIPVVTGVMLATWSEVNFNWPGFTCAIVASVTTAIQSIVAGFLLTGKLKMDPVNLVNNVSPFAIMLLLPFVYMWEWEAIQADSHLFTPTLNILLLISSCIAFALNFAVFYAIQNTNTLTFTVAGNLKVVFVIFISVAIFRNEVTWLNALGIVTCIVGCWFYNSVQYRKKQKKLAAKAGNI